MNDLEATEWANRPWHVKLTAMIIGCLLRPLKAVSRLER
jgi:hypothetical protein